MSMPTYKVCCDKCDFQAWSYKLWGAKEYVDSKGEEIPLDTTFSWCNKCQSIEPIESFDNTATYVSKLHQSLAAIKADTNSIIKLFFIRLMSSVRVTDKYFLNESQVYARKIEQDIKRKGTEKCLTCGSNNVELYAGDKSIGWHLFPEVDGENAFINIQHPNCGGEFYIPSKLNRIGMALERRMFSLDGLEIKNIENE